MSVPREHHEALYAAYVAELEARWPGFRVMDKRDSPFCRLIDRLLRAITFGGQRGFLTQYITTFGRRIYVPESWERLPAGERYCILRHEAVHVAQFRALTWPGITLVYLLLPVPVGFAAGRAFLEWQGYRETLTATWQVEGPEAARNPALHQRIVARFTGPDYVWMWVRAKTVRAAIARHLARLEQAPPPPLVVLASPEGSRPRP